MELLIVAHDCFSLTCNMEGIVRVLQAARHLSHAHLAPGEHFSLLVPPTHTDETSSCCSYLMTLLWFDKLMCLQVRLLTGIGRYNEMTYVFDLLHQNHRFEILLRKNVDVDRRQVGTSSSPQNDLQNSPVKPCLAVVGGYCVTSK